MNELQKIEFDIFLHFDEICKKLEINYFLLSGSALGAVRHNGFIPWDDDLDVGMYREDYKKFIDLAPSLLPANLFLQNHKSDPSAPFAYSKLRNSNTTFIESSIAKLDMNHGVFIDIFPLDGFPKNKLRQKKLALQCKLFRWKIYCGVDLKFNFKSKIWVFALKSLGYHKKTAKTIEKFETMIAHYSPNNSDIICSHGNRYGERDYMPKEYYGNGTYMMFEGIRVRVPEKYDEYLTRLYGNWHTPPPTEERKDIHPCLICDPYTPYMNYFKNSNLKEL